MTTTRTTQQWQEADSKHFLHPFTDHQALAAKGARVVERAEGIYIWDTDGNKILDGMSGLWCVNVGYGAQELIDAWILRPATSRRMTTASHITRQGTSQ